MNATEKWIAKNIKLFRSEGYSVFKQLVAVREGKLMRVRWLVMTIIHL